MGEVAAQEPQIGILQAELKAQCAEHAQLQAHCCGLERCLQRAVLSTRSYKDWAFDVECELREVAAEFQADHAADTRDLMLLQKRALELESGRDVVSRTVAPTQAFESKRSRENNTALDSSFAFESDRVFDHRGGVDGIRSFGEDGWFDHRHTSRQRRAHPRTNGQPHANQNAHSYSCGHSPNRNHHSPSGPRWPHGASHCNGDARYLMPQQDTNRVRNNNDSTFVLESDCSLLHSNGFESNRDHMARDWHVDAPGIYQESSYLHRNRGSGPKYADDRGHGCGSGHRHIHVKSNYNTDGHLHYQTLGTPRRTNGEKVLDDGCRNHITDIGRAECSELLLRGSFQTLAPSFKPPPPVQEPTALPRELQQKSVARDTGPASVLPHACPPLAPALC